MLDRTDKQAGPKVNIDDPVGQLDSRIGWGSDVAAQMLHRQRARP